jgi:hypothetical protein
MRHSTPAFLVFVVLAAQAGAASRFDARGARPRAAAERWPEAVAFISGDCSLKSNKLSVFRIGNTRAYTEFDLPMPSKIGRWLYFIKPARPGVEPKLLLDAGKGCIGSPCGSLDGKSVLVSMAREGESFYHIYKVPTGGGTPKRITDGPFHDLDPEQLPDGRIVFSSTRIGTFEEYHSSPARALFVMNGDGSGIHPISLGDGLEIVGHPVPASSECLIADHVHALPASSVRRLRGPGDLKRPAKPQDHRRDRPQPPRPRTSSRPRHQVPDCGSSSRRCHR